MRIAERKVYYCDFCRKHRLSRAAMERHEETCTSNTSRVCRWKIDGHSGGARVIDIGPLADALRARATSWPVSADPEADERTYLTADDIDWGRGEVDGCPACMLAVLRQSAVSEFHVAYHGGTIFDYDAEVERLRAEECDHDRADVW